MAKPDPSAEQSITDKADRISDGLQRLPDDTERLFHDLGQWFRRDSVDLTIAAAGAFFIYAILFAIRRWVRVRRDTAIPGSWSWVVLRTLGRTRSFFMTMIGVRLMEQLLPAPGTWSTLIATLFTISAVIQGALWVQELLFALLERRANRDADPHGAIGSALGVIRILIGSVVWIFAAIILLDNLGVNVTALVAGLGVGGITIGLAAQGIFSDLFAALSILFDQPFRRGDAIQLGNGVTGTVEHIGLKTTRLRAPSGEVVVMSNTNILSEPINNLSAYDQRRVVMTLTVIYQTPADILPSIPKELEDIINQRLRCRFERAHFVNFGTSSIDFELAFWVDEPAYLVMMDERQAVAFAILRRFDELGIQFAYPSQTSFMAGPDGQIIDPRETGGLPLPKPAPPYTG